MTEPASALTAAVASRLARAALGHVGREYPNRLDHVLTGPHDLRAPRDLHPVFYGSFDWHSCVHAFWLLARLRRRFPDLPKAAEIAALLDSRLTPAAVAGERAYLDAPGRGGFERPYGWAWLLLLQAELAHHADRSWGASLQPLAQAFAALFVGYLGKSPYPIRAGGHSNTAFALHLALQYADAADDRALAAAARQRALAWYGADAACQAWEPSGEDFLSPALMEAACLCRVMPAAAFAAWFDRFLPALAAGEPATLFAPVTPSDRTDGRIVHLDGLNLSRAWCWRLLAASLPAGDARLPRMRAAVQAHLDASLGAVTGHYMGEHWLASFALLALDQAPSGRLPT